MAALVSKSKLTKFSNSLWNIVLINSNKRYKTNSSKKFENHFDRNIKNELLINIVPFVYYTKVLYFSYNINYGA